MSAPFGSAMHLVSYLAIAHFIISSIATFYVWGHALPSLKLLQINSVIVKNYFDYQD